MVPTRVPSLLLWPHSPPSMVPAREPGLLLWPHSPPNMVPTAGEFTDNVNSMCSFLADSMSFGILFSRIHTCHFPTIVSSEWLTVCVNMVHACVSFVWGRITSLLLLDLMQIDLIMKNQQGYGTHKSGSSPTFVSGGCTRVYCIQHGVLIISSFPPINVKNWTIQHERLVLKFQHLS
jgi:hypothetical protein